MKRWKNRWKDIVKNKNTNKKTIKKYKMGLNYLKNDRNDYKFTKKLDKN